MASGVTIFAQATTPANPSSIPSGGNAFLNYVPFSDGPNGQQSKIYIDTVVPGTGTMHMEVWDLTNQITFAQLGAIYVTDVATGKYLFQGIMQKIKAKVVATYRIWIVDCIDLNGITDTTLVGTPNGTLWEVTVTSSGPVATNVDPAAQTTRPAMLFSNYWQYGAHIDTTTYVDTTLVYNTANTPIFDRVTLRKALDVCASYVGAYVTWWLDQQAALHWTNWAQVTNVGVVGAGTGGAPGAPTGLTAAAGNTRVTLSWSAPTSTSATVTGFSTGGPLTMLFPVGTPNAIPGTSSAYTAPYLLTDGAADNVTTVNYENFEMETDYSGFRFSLYVRGGTDYTGTISQIVPGAYNVYPVTVGGTGWVAANGDGGTSWMSDFYDQPNAVDHATRNALGMAALQKMQVPIVRGSCDVIAPAGLTPFFVGQTITITNGPVALTAANFFITRCQTSFLSGDDKRRYALQWGTAPKMNMALRAQTQKANQPVPKKGATVHDPGASASAASPGQAVTVSTQLKNSNGDPWAIPGKTVNWTCQVLDSTGADVTATTSFTLNPTSSTTDASGKASTVLTTDATKTGVSYYVTATTPS